MHEANLNEGVYRLTYLAKHRENRGAPIQSCADQLFTNNLKPPDSILSIKPFQAIAYGSTANNRREFNFFLRTLKEHGITCSLSNLADSPRLLPIKDRLHYSNGFLLELWKDISRLAGDLTDEATSPLHLNYVLQFFRSYFLFSASLLSRSIRNTIPFALVSNDHAPIPVAFAQACRSYNIPVGYIQHAEVSDRFPPLAFDFSVLNNTVSRQTYYSIDPALPPTFILSRFESPPNRDKLISELRSTVKVGLFLTVSCDYDRVADLITTLKSNPLVASVVIQPHPRTPHNALRQLSDYGVAMGKINMDEIDVAVSQNTSTVIQLLHHGIKTLQIFEYDSSPPDYYGFVKSGIVPRVTAADLATPFWNKFKHTRDWEQKYGRYNPNYAGTDETKSLITYLLAHLTGLQKEHRNFAAPEGCTTAQNDVLPIGPNNDLRLFYNKQLEHALCSWITSNPNLDIDEVNEKATRIFGKLFQRNGSKDLNQSLKNTISNLYQERNPSIVAWMNQGAKSLTSTSLGVWIALYSRFWTSASLTNNEFQFFQSLNEQHDTSIGLVGNESLLCCLVVRREDPSLTQRFLSLFSDISAVGLDLRARTDLGRHIFKHRTNFPNHKKLYSQLVHGLSGLDRLRVEILGCARRNVDHELNHKAVESEVLQASCQELQKELKTLIFPAYEKRREQLMFMETFWSAEQRMTFFQYVDRALARRQPFSFVRLSDGEGWIFADGSGPFTVEDERNRERHWWGRSPSATDKATVRAAALAAVSSANILGIPSIYRILQSVGSRSKTLQSNVTQRGLLQVLSALHDLGCRAFGFSDEKANIALFENARVISKWIERAENTVFVSSVEPVCLEPIFGSALNLARVEFVEIPTHFRTRSNPRYSSQYLILPEKYRELESFVAEKVKPGSLLLNASGVAGKGFNAIAQSNGAVAIDLGGAIDAWVRASTV